MIVNDNQLEQLKKTIFEELSRKFQLSHIEFEQMTDFQKLIHNRVRRMVSDLHGKARKQFQLTYIAGVTEPFITKEKIDQGTEIDLLKPNHIVDARVVVKKANGGGSMNRFHKTQNKS